MTGATNDARESITMAIVWSKQPECGIGYPPRNQALDFLAAGLLWLPVFGTAPQDDRIFMYRSRRHKDRTATDP